MTKLSISKATFRAADLGSSSWAPRPGFLLSGLQLLWSCRVQWRGCGGTRVEGSPASQPRGWGPSRAPGGQQPRLPWGLVASLSEVTNPLMNPAGMVPPTRMWLHHPLHSGHHRQTSVLRQADDIKEGPGGSPHCDEAWIPDDNPLGRTAPPQASDGHRDKRGWTRERATVRIIGRKTVSH